MVSDLVTLGGVHPLLRSDTVATFTTPNVHRLFIIEGAMTMFIGFLTILILPDFPHNSRGFTPEERKLAVLRMAEDAGQSDSDETSTWKAFVSAMLDYRMHLMALTLTAMVIGLSFNAFCEHEGLRMSFL